MKKWRHTQTYEEMAAHANSTCSGSMWHGARSSDDVCTHTHTHTNARTHARTHAHTARSYIARRQQQRQRLRVRERESRVRRRCPHSHVIKRHVIKRHAINRHVTACVRLCLCAPVCDFSLVWDSLGLTPPCRQLVRLLGWLQLLAATTRLVAAPCCNYSACCSSLQLLAATTRLIAAPRCNYSACCSSLLQLLGWLQLLAATTWLVAAPRCNYLACCIPCCNCS
jgi:hypothetical protein